MYKVLAAVLLMIPLLGLGGTLHFATLDTVHDVTITDKERVTKGDESYYLVFTDKEVFKNEDSLWAFKFRSSDLQGSLMPGDTCDLEVTGFRIGFFSSYRNILSATCNTQ